MTDSSIVVVQPTQPAHLTPVGVYLGGLRPSSRETMFHALVSIVRVLTDTPDDSVDIFRFPWELMDIPQITLLRTMLSEKFATATANNYLMALKGVLKCAWRLGLIDRDTYERRIDFKPIKGESLPAGRYVEMEERALLFNALRADKTWVGARDGAIIGTLFATGMRRQELTGLLYENLEPLKGQEVGYTLKILKGKGNKSRMAYIGPDAVPFVQRWLAHRGTHSGAYITKQDGTGITTQTVYDILSKWSLEVGITQIRPHDTRRTVITDLREAGMEDSMIMEITGHSSVEMVSRYDRKKEQRVKMIGLGIKFPGTPDPK